MTDEHQKKIEKKAEELIEKKFGKIFNSFSSINDSITRYEKNIFEIKIVLYLIYLLIVVGLVILGCGTFLLLSYEHAIGFIMGKYFVVNNISGLIIIGIGSFWLVGGLIFLYTQRSRLREIPKYLNAIESLNLLKVSINMMSEYKNINTVNTFTEEGRIKIVDKVLEILKNMDVT